MIKDFFTDQFEKYIQYYYSLLKEGTFKWGELKKLTEFVFLLDDFIEMGILDPVDKIYLERISNSIADKIRFDRIIFYYSSFHYFYNKIAYNKNYGDLSEEVYQINIQINIMRIQIRHQMITGCSEDDYFFVSRGKELIDALDILYRRGEEKNREYNAVMYMLLNYTQALIEYLQCEDDHYYESVCEILSTCMDVILGMCKDFMHIKENLKNNVKFKMFLYDILNKYQKLFPDKLKFDWGEKISIIESSDKLINNIWAARNLYDFDSAYFQKYFSDHLTTFELFYNRLYEDSKIMYLRCCIRWLKEKNENSFTLLKLPPLNDENDNSWFSMEQYFYGYSESASVDVTTAEIETVQAYNDNELREKIANIMYNVDKHVVNRECKKPHGVYEIADMEIPIKNSQGKVCYICIPVKSGVEISKKVTEDIAYQVIRPFTYFGNKAIVVFVSAKEATEAFYNYVKRAKTNLDFEIYVIAGEELVKLLKYNMQI